VGIIGGKGAGFSDEIETQHDMAVKVSKPSVVRARGSQMRLKRFQAATPASLSEVVRARGSQMRLKHSLTPRCRETQDRGKGAGFSDEIETYRKVHQVRGLWLW